MYYDPNYINWGRQGWSCPKCGRVYSPDTPQCWYCNGGTKTIPSTTTATPEWIYKDDPSKGTAAPDNWWSTYINTSLADALSSLNISL